MDPIITNTLRGAIIAAIGWMGKSLHQSIKDYRTGHKEELQQREEQIIERKSQAALLKRKYKDLDNEYRYLRAWILSQPLTEERLERMP